MRTVGLASQSLPGLLQGKTKIPFTLPGDKNGFPEVKTSAAYLQEETQDPASLASWPGLAQALTQALSVGSASVFTATGSASVGI